MVSWLLRVASWRMPPGPLSPKRKIGVVCCPGNNKAEGGKIVNWRVFVVNRNS